MVHVVLGTARHKSIKVSQIKVMERMLITEGRLYKLSNKTITLTTDTLLN